MEFILTKKEKEIISRISNELDYCATHTCDDCVLLELCTLCGDEVAEFILDQAINIA